MLTCQLGEFGSMKPYIFVVVLSRVGDQLLLSRHKQRQTWETQGGHIEQGETPEQAAARELYEESGARASELVPLCDYTAGDEKGQSSGAVFVARIAVLEQMPDSEMAEIRLFDTLPSEDKLTYPWITPKLYKKAKEQGLFS